MAYNGPLLRATRFSWPTAGGNLPSRLCFFPSFFWHSATLCDLTEDCLEVIWIECWLDVQGCKGLSFTVWHGNWIESCWDTSSWCIVLGRLICVFVTIFHYLNKKINKIKSDQWFPTGILMVREHQGCIGTCSSFCQKIWWVLLVKKLKCRFDLCVFEIAKLI